MVLVMVFIHFDWQLTLNQLNLIKVRRFRDEFKEDIKLCLDEVNKYKYKYILKKNCKFINIF